MITVLVSFPIPSKYHPKYKGLKLLKPQIFGFFQGYTINGFALIGVPHL